MTEVLVIFWIKRAWRLWPVAWGVALFSFVSVTLLCPKYIDPDYFLAIFSNWISIVLNIQNLMVYQSHTGMGFHNYYYELYWSLSLEEQLYLIFAIVVVLLKPKAGAALCGILIIVQSFIHRPALSEEFWWYVRSDAFCWGVLLGYLSENKEKFKKLEPTFLSNKKMSFFLFSFLLVVIATPQLMYGCSFYVSIMSLASGVLVYLSSYDSGYIPSSGKLKQLLVKIGDYSYSLYLVHMPVLVVIYNYIPEGKRQGVIGGGVFLLYLLVSFLISLMVSKCIENKYKEHGRKLADDYLKKIMDANKNINESEREILTKELNK